MTEKMVKVLSLALDMLEETLQKKELTAQVQAELSILNQIATNVVICENILLKEQVKSLLSDASVPYPEYPQQSG